MKARIDSTSRATSSDHRKDWRKKTRAMTLASTRRSSPSSAPMTVVSARRSSVRRASGSRATPLGAASAVVIALGRAQSPLVDIWPYRAALSATWYGSGSTATLLWLRMAFLPIGLFKASPCFAAIERQLASPSVIDEIVGIEAANVRNIGQKPVE